MRAQSLLLGCIVIGGCSALDAGHPPERPHEQVSIEPLGDVAAAPSVLRVRVKGAAGRSALADFWLFSGHLTTYYLRRLKARDVPDTLEARTVAVVTWADGADVVVAPTEALPSGTFSLATPELGLVTEVTVTADLVPWLARRWPPKVAAEGTGLAIFCGDGVAAASAGEVTLAPSGTRADVRLGVADAGSFGDACLTLAPRAGAAAGALSLPPALVGGVALEPLPLVTMAPGPHATECPDGQLVLGPACASPDDDRVVLRAYAAPSFWAFETPVHTLASVEPGASYVVKGFQPETVVKLHATTLDVAGGGQELDVELALRAPHAHVVINEVLSNPAGSEASSEWVELANDGTAAVDLDGFTLRDAGGAVRLPSARIEPGELVLLVDERFDPDGALDVLPTAGTRLVRLPKLGTDGLSNGGEPLRLLDASGHLLSLFPSLPGREAGVSVARRTPDAPDDDSRAFGTHAAPGASPGAPNVLAPP